MISGSNEQLQQELEYTQLKRPAFFNSDQRHFYTHTHTHTHIYKYIYIYKALVGVTGGVSKYELV